MIAECMYVHTICGTICNSRSERWKQAFGRRSIFQKRAAADKIIVYSQLVTFFLSSFALASCFERKIVANILLCET